MQSSHQTDRIRRAFFPCALRLHEIHLIVGWFWFPFFVRINFRLITCFLLVLFGRNVEINYFVCTGTAKTHNCVVSLADDSSFILMLDIFTCISSRFFCFFVFLFIYLPTKCTCDRNKDTQLNWIWFKYVHLLGQRHWGKANKYESTEKSKMSNWCSIEN